MASAEQTSSLSGGARWLAGILVGLVFGSLSTLGTVQLNHERRLSGVEARQEDNSRQLDRMERKLDHLLLRGEP